MLPKSFNKLSPDSQTVEYTKCVGRFLEARYKVVVRQSIPYFHRAMEFRKSNEADLLLAARDLLAPQEIPYLTRIATVEEQW